MFSLPYFLKNSSLEDEVQYQGVKAGSLVFPGVSEEPEDSRPRRRWDRGPPERLLSLLEKARLNRAFSTFIIHTGGLLKSEYDILSDFAVAHN